MSATVRSYGARRFSDLLWIGGILLGEFLGVLANTEGCRKAAKYDFEDLRHFSTKWLEGFGVRLGVFWGADVATSSAIDSPHFGAVVMLAGRQIQRRGRLRVQFLASRGQSGARALPKQGLS